jgi:hypothetical protein
MHTFWCLVFGLIKYGGFCFIMSNILRWSSLLVCKTGLPDFFLTQYTKTIKKHTKLPQNFQMTIFPSDHLLWPSKIYTIWEFWFEKIPSGNPGARAAGTIRVICSVPLLEQILRSQVSPIAFNFFLLH